MALVLDATIHVDTTLFASVPLNSRLGIYDRKFVSVRLQAEVFTRDDSNLREQRAFPALRAATHVIVCALPVDRPRDLVLRSALSVRGDERRLRRAVRNLLENAQRYGGTEVRASLAPKPASPMLELRICDRGPGVPLNMR